MTTQDTTQDTTQKEQSSQEENLQNETDKQQEKQEQTQEVSSDENTNDTDWKKEAEIRKQKYQEAEEIGKKAQFDYYNIKMDFDGYVQRMEQKEKTQKIETLCSMVRKFLPFVESLRKSIDTIPQEKHEEPLVKGIILTYNKFIQTLGNM